MSQSLVIVPTYNESENISSLILKIFNEIPEIHILVVDDNSPDKTYEIVKKLSQNFKQKLFLEIRSNKSKTNFVDTNKDLYNFKPKKDRASKIISYLGNILVNGHPDIKGRINDFNGSSSFCIVSISNNNKSLTS